VQVLLGAPVYDRVGAAPVIAGVAAVRASLGQLVRALVANVPVVALDPDDVHVEELVGSLPEMDG